VGVHIPSHPVPLAVIETLGCPLYSITAKRTMCTGAKIDSDDDADSGDAGNTISQRFELPPIPEEELFEGGWELEAIEDLDYILDTGDERPRIFSTILDMTGDEVRLIRPGAGPWPV
jgi:tRNA A37 threonylcarbamoyladenosine synthetase subunit TsaC/SUA5/YrdC